MKKWVGFNGARTYAKHYPLSVLQKVAARPCRNSKHTRALEAYDSRIVPANALSLFGDPSGGVRAILCADCVNAGMNALARAALPMHGKVIENDGEIMRVRVAETAETVCFERDEETRAEFLKRFHVGASMDMRGWKGKAEELVECVVEDKVA